MSQIHDFAENSCYRDGKFRSTRVQACFRIESYGKIRGVRVRGDFYADFGIFYDPDNEYITEILQEHFPEVDWSGLIFHRTMDSSKIYLMEHDSFEEIAEIRIRQADNKERPVITDHSNVVDMLNWRPKG